MIPLDTAQLTARLAQRDPIEGASLDAVDWTDLDAEDARFADCLFQDTAFAGTRLAGATFRRCRFLRCRFARAELADTTWEGCAFLPREAGAEGDPPEGCSFTFCDLRNARFLTCDLSLCRIDRSDLFNIAMDQCILRGARFLKADFSHAYSRKQVATRATFRHCNFELADLGEARLPGCDLTGSRLREADLTGVDLTGAVLRDCDLFQATLAQARLANADLRGAEISGLNLLALASFLGLKITQGQQHVLLDGTGVDVHPEPG